MLPSVSLIPSEERGGAKLRVVNPTAKSKAALSLSSPWMGDPMASENWTNHLLVPLGKKLNSSFPAPSDESINRDLV